MRCPCRLTQIIETIRAIRIGVPVSKGGVTYCWNRGLTYTGMPWSGGDGLDQSASGSRRSDRTHPRVRGNAWRAAHLFPGRSTQAAGLQFHRESSWWLGESL